jgi:uncharacterized membrane protein
MHKGRLEAFSDGVMAIIITIMILELKTPQEGTLSALLSLAPKFMSYAFSFVFIGIYWNNHHHLLQATKTVNGAILWANLHLLFWLSLIPFVTGWIGESHFAAIPVAIYGAILWLSGLAYFILVQTLVAHHDENSVIGMLSKDPKAIMSLILYSIGIPCSFISPWIALSFFMCVAIIWLIPDKRIERKLKE